MTTAEHIIELQTMNMFFDYLMDDDNNCLVDCDFFLQFFNKEVLKSAPDMQGGLHSEIPSERIMETLGSKLNTENFVLLHEGLNGLKGRVRNDSCVEIGRSTLTRHALFAALGP